MRPTSITLLLLVAIGSGFVYADESPATAPFSLRLSVGPSVVPPQSSPRLRLSVTNISPRPQRLLPPARYPSLYHLKVTRNGAPYDIGRPIIDQPAPTDEDFLILAPRQTVTFLVPAYISDFSDAPEGMYRVVLLLWPLWSTELQWQSSPATFFIRRGA